MLIISVSAGIGPEYFELFVEKVVTMAAISDAIVHYELLEYLNCSVAVERQIFTIAVDYLALLLQPLLDAAPAGALVA